MAGRNNIRNWQLGTGLGVVVILALLYALYFFRTPPPCIPDKIEVHIYRQPAVDSALIDGQMKEIQYYLRTHNVTDEGYDLVAQYNTQLSRISRYSRQSRSSRQSISQRTIAAKDRLLPAVKTAGGYWKAGHFHLAPVNGRGIVRDWQGRIVCGIFANDTIVIATRTDTLGTYRGQMDAWLQACGQGTFDGIDGTHYEGFWQDDRQHGFGFESSPHHPVRVGQWKNGKFLGERISYTSERIYGIDISRHQHEKGRKRYRIDWRKVRITSLGHKHPANGQTFPVSFVYIKSTEGTSIRNRYFLSDYQQAKRQGLRLPLLLHPHLGTGTGQLLCHSYAVPQGRLSTRNGRRADSRPSGTDRRYRGTPPTCPYLLAHRGTAYRNATYLICQPDVRQPLYAAR